MNIIGLVQARLGSSRFPNKVLQELGGVPVLLYQYRRTKKSRLLTGVFVITTGSPKDDSLCEFMQKHRIPYLRGSENDVLDRYYNAAKQLKADIIVRMTADCPLIDGRIIDQVINEYLKGGYDFVSNSVPLPSTYPDGMDVEVFSFSALRRAWLEAQKPSEREHVTFYMWKNPDSFRVKRLDYKEDRSNVRLTLDYPDDLDYLKKLAVKLDEDAGLEDILKAADTIKDKRDHKTGEGWKVSKDMPCEKAEPLHLEKTSKDWNDTVSKIPGGAQTFSKMPLQYVDGVAPKKLYRGIGSRVWDLDGNEYIDYVMALGPIILGHSFAEVNEAASKCAADLFCSPSLPHPMELELADKIIKLVPCAQMVRFGKNGSDVTAGAVRLARAYTKRDIIACSGYHGWQDWYIGSTSRRLGVPLAVQSMTKQFEYNDISSLKKIFDEYPKAVAAVIMEPVNFYPPEEGFLEGVKKLCESNGAVLIFDEVITGFRIGINGAQGHFKVTPHLATFGKAIANGYPLSVLCGRKDIMSLLDEAFFSFTFAGELPSIAAALKTIEIIEREDVAGHINRIGSMLRDGYNEIAGSLGLDFTRCFGYGWWPEYDFDDTEGFTKLELLTLMQQELVKRGILTRQAPFISLSHNEGEVYFTLKAMKEAMSVVASAVSKKNLKDLLEGSIIQPIIRNVR